ncbi:MAG: adenylate/guanylate cyclase domain-containing protein [Arenicellales bacterium]|nr:adenylate/guanylate cyclase domain-containing protein [Arenicellales bacterium]
MSDITNWLEKIGLGKYAQAFVDNEIDFAILPSLSDQDLESIGLPLGPRRKLQQALTTSHGHPQITPEPRAEITISEAERRHLTVMFCDLVGSTQISEQLDPEDFREVIGEFRKACSDAIKAYDGYIARFMGDGLLVYFGYPQAHEDDAERAVRAGLAIIDGVPKLKALEKGSLQVRVGIATGLVVAGDLIGEGGSEERAVLGDTPNLAARLQGLAQPNSVVVNDSLHRLVAGLFVCNDLGEQSLKGISTPVHVYQVIEETSVAGRFEAASLRGLTPLVGREEEIGLLVRRWQQAKDGEGQVVLLSAEAGVGKSRILSSFQKKTEGESRNRVLWFCSIFYQNTALHPVIDQLERALRVDKDDTPDQKLDKLTEVINRLSLPGELVSVFAQLLSIPNEGRYTNLDLRPDELRSKTLQAVIDVIEAMAAQLPVLFVVEDVHWVDPTTLELLSQLVERLRETRVLMVITFRPEFQCPWSSGPNITSYSLNHLSRHDSAAMIAKVAGGKPLPSDIVDQIVARTDGVPLFVEELTKNLLESGYLIDAGERYALSEPLPQLAIPESLQDSLMARLDHLASVKEVAQLCAVIGRIFSHELIAAVSPLDGTALDEALNQLVESGLVYRRGQPPKASYQFKHALVQDVAYQSLLKSTRVQFHSNIARILNEQFPAEVAAEPELLAYHYTQAGLTEQAITYWQKAGEQAVAGSANKEAVNHFAKALELLEELAESPRRYQQELGLRIDIGTPLMATRGFASPEVARTYKRARELCDLVGDKSQIFPATWGLWHSMNQTGRIDEACSLADELIAIGKRQQDSGLLLEAYHAAWTSCFAGRDLKSVREHTEKGITLYDKDLHHKQTFRYGGHDPGVCSRFISAMANCLLGYPDQARDLAEDGVVLATQLNHSFSLALALSFSSTVYLLRREPHRIQSQCEKLNQLCAEHGFPHFSPMVSMLRGWSLASESQFEEGISLMQEGLAASRAVGVKRLSFHLFIMAEVYLWAGAFRKGMDTVVEAENVVEATGEHRWEAEILRVKGDLLSKNPDVDVSEAEVAYKRAIELARQQKARLFELRATTSFARLRQNGEERTDTLDALAALYGWFTEGFTTADLQEAKALLESGMSS